MTQPVSNVPCYSGPCGVTIWQGGAIVAGEVAELPFGRLVEDRDGVTFELTAEGMITDYADSTCPVGGCPNTTAAVEVARLQQPAVMAAAIADLQASGEALQARVAALEAAAAPPE